LDWSKTHFHDILSLSFVYTVYKSVIVFYSFSIGYTGMVLLGHINYTDKLGFLYRFNPLSENLFGTFMRRYTLVTQG